MASDTTFSQGGKGLLLKADPIALQFRDEVKSSLAQRPKPPKLVGILATSSAPSKNYAEFTRKQCEELGFEFVLRKTGAAIDSDAVEGGERLGEGEGVEEAIIEANEDESVDGIMVSRFESVLVLLVFDTGFFLLVHVCIGLFPNFWTATGWLEFGALFVVLNRTQ